MRQELNLFIGDREVEFNQPPEIMYNYTQTEATNPTVVKNSYSKTITIEGTSQNNDIFGHIWNLERVQYYGVGVYTGADFNPLQKADFTLYLNGEIYEEGYCRLDEVRKEGNNIEYDITLYGGLGSFFYNLTYSHNEAGEVEGPDKLTLADLDYSCEEEGDISPDLSFKIDKDTVWDAWQTVVGGNGDIAAYSEDEVKEKGGRPNAFLYDNKWKIINFAPCYNGIPENLDAAKVLINKDGFADEHIPASITENEETYTNVNGYLLAETNEEMTEWETRDLRSYLQRPVINMRRLILACCNPDNNGGYTVDLDSHFFNLDNPYWQDSWMTLPLLENTTSYTKSETTITQGTLEKAENYLYNIKATGISTYATYNSLDLELKVTLTPDDTTNPFYYLSSHVSGKYLFPGLSYIRYYNKRSSIIVQMVAFDGAGGIVAVSNAYELTTGFPTRTGVAIWGNNTTDFATDEIPVPKYQVLNGSFMQNDDGVYVWSMGMKEKPLKFSFGAIENASRIALKIMTPECETWRYYTQLISDSYSAWNKNASVLSVYTKAFDNLDDGVKLDKARGLNLHTATVNYEITDISMSVSDYSSVISGTYISKDALLSTDKTPCDYLLSYCKMFGLYFYKEPDNKVIHIMDRNTFYDTTDVVDLSKLIDRGKAMKITPQSPASKWYTFAQESTESEANTDYNATYGYDYGLQRINTGYNFDAESTELLKDNAFKSGVQVLEQSKNYLKNIINEPFYLFNGCKVTYFKPSSDGFDTAEKEMDIHAFSEEWLKTLYFHANDKLKRYDLFSKPQFHKADNAATDGDGVLLFFSVQQDTSYNPDITYWITDDVEDMMELNDGTPCWLLTSQVTNPNKKDAEGNAVKIAYPINSLPMFSRNVVYGGISGTITHSWDFGNPQETFVPELKTSREQGIYHKYWKGYINDMYSVNTRVLTCYVLLENRPNPDWLRRFYWFDNAIWRLNKIVDWNVSSYDTTQMEFIKVQDLNNYKVAKIEPTGDWYIKLNASTIGAEGGTITGVVYYQSGLNWAWSDYLSYESEDGTVKGSVLPCDIINPCTSTTGTVNITITVPANTTGKALKWTLSAENSIDEWAFAYITQSAEAVPTDIKVTPTTIYFDNDSTTATNLTVSTTGTYNLTKEEV